MTNPLYVRGRAYEYEVKKRYEKMGYWVIRAAGSRGVADLVAIKDGVSILIQCKIGKISNAEERELDRTATKCGAGYVIEVKR